MLIIYLLIFFIVVVFLRHILVTVSHWALHWFEFSLRVVVLYLALLIACLFFLGIWVFNRPLSYLILINLILLLIRLVLWIHLALQQPILIFLNLLLNLDLLPLEFEQLLVILPLLFLSFLVLYFFFGLLLHFVEHVLRFLELNLEICLQEIVVLQ